MTIKKLTFCILFFTHAINLAEEDDSDNKKISISTAEEDNSDNKKFSISTVEEDSSITKNNWNTRKWGSIYLLFNTIMFLVDITPEYSWLTFFRIFTGDILYRYIAKKGVGVMLKFGFNSSFISFSQDTLIRLSPSLTLSFCWVYKKKGNKMFSGSICPIGVGWGNEQFEDEEIHKFTKENYFIPFLNISYLHYENGKGFFLSWGKIYMVYSENWFESLYINSILSIFHLELGFSLLKSKHRKKY